MLRFAQGETCFNTTIKRENRGFKKLSFSELNLVQYYEKILHRNPKIALTPIQIYYKQMVKTHHFDDNFPVGGKLDSCVNSNVIMEFITSVVS